jgi:hypothetical protein
VARNPAASERDDANQVIGNGSVMRGKGKGMAQDGFLDTAAEDDEELYS